MQELEAAGSMAYIVSKHKEMDLEVIACLPVCLFICFVFVPVFIQPSISTHGIKSPIIRVYLPISINAETYTESQKFVF